jgi:hypothetical protein
MISKWRFPNQEIVVMKPNCRYFDADDLLEILKCRFAHVGFDFVIPNFRLPNIDIDLMESDFRLSGVDGHLRRSDGDFFWEMAAASPQMSDGSASHPYPPCSRGALAPWRGSANRKKWDW